MIPQPTSETRASSHPIPIRAGIYGASGYAGADAVELLTRHPAVDLVFATSTTYADAPVPHSDLRYTLPQDADAGAVDVVFLAMPHGVAAQTAVTALEAGARVVDLSADFRLDTPERYQQWYGHPHPYPDMLPIPYGLPEINRERLPDARLIAAPGCYPTTTLLGLLPLLKHGWIAGGRPIIVDAKSGVSGAGREPKPHLHFVEVYGNLSPYSTGRVHRHVGEIEQEIAKLQPDAGALIFTPHLLPVDRGLMASLYVELVAGRTSDGVQALYEAAYAEEPLVRVLPAGDHATLKHVVKTNGCAISITPATPTLVHITSVTDNLRKGAAGQAVQCMNLMFGLPETLGLL